MAYKLDLTQGDIIEIRRELNKNTNEIIPARVVEIVTNRPVPDVDEEVIGTEDDPAVKIEIFSNDNGVLTPTGKFAAYKSSELKRIMRS